MSPDAQLLYSAARGDTAAVHALLGQGVCVNVQDGRGRTPLMLAANGRFSETVRLLLEAGADCLVVNKGNRPLIDYVHTADVARMVLAAAPPADQGRIATRLLFQYGLPVQVVQVAVEFGAQVNARNKRGDTPLHIHASAGSVECVRYLLAAGAWPDLKNCHGKTPLYVAISLAYDDIARYLISAGADIHTTDAKGRTLMDLINSCNCSACKECAAVLQAAENR